MMRTLVLTAAVTLLTAVGLSAQVRFRAELDDGSRIDLVHGRPASQNATGARSHGLLEITEGRHLRIWVRNDSPPALPDGRGGVLPNVPLLLKTAEVSVPAGWHVLHASHIGARVTRGQGELDTWHLITATTRKPRHSRYPERSRSAHYVEGGHQLWWDIVRNGHVPYPEPPRDGELAAKIRHFREMGPGGLDALPRKLRGLKRIWSVDVRPHRYGLDDWAAKRFGGRIPFDGTPILFGAIPWGDRWCNHHYDMIGHAIESHLLGVPEAWRAATVMARQHLQAGVYDSGGHRYARMHVYEKTGGLGDYPGDGTRPQDSHEWDAGLIEWALMSRDPMALRWLERRADRLAAYQPHEVWNGAGGVRQLGWTLRNMRAFTWYGVRDMSREMAALLTHAFKVNGDTEWWRNAYTRTAFAPWMQALTNVEIDRALKGPLKDHEKREEWNSKLRAKVAFQVAHVVRLDERGRITIPHNVDDMPTKRFTIRYQTAQMGWSIPHLALAVEMGIEGADAKLAAARSAFLRGSRPYDRSGAVGGGPAALKTWASAHQWGARGALWSER